MARANLNRGANRRGNATNRGRGGNRNQAGNRRHPRRRVARTATDASGENRAYKSFDPCTEDFKLLFTDPAYNVDAHRGAQEHDLSRYMATMLALTEHSVDLLQASRTRCLAAAWIRSDHKLSTRLLTTRADDFDVATVSKALQLLDSGRRSRATEKKIAMCRDQMKKAGQKGKTRIGKRKALLKKLLNNQRRDAPEKGAVSGALARHIRRDWLPTISGAQLESWAVHMSGDAWKSIADLCHINPKQDMKECPWFLSYVFEGKEKVPSDSLPGKCLRITKDNVNEVIQGGVQVPLAHLKEHATALNNDSKLKIAKYTPSLDTLIWEYEWLQSTVVDSVIAERLAAGERVSLPYGKLLERLLTVRLASYRLGTPVAGFYEKLLPLAEQMLGEITLPVESPVCVIGDASASMDIAIRTSTIIASFLRACCGSDASLVFFSDKAIQPLFVPKNVGEVLDLAMQTRTVGCTCHASALYPLYRKKRVVKTFFVVTDEEENTDHVVDGETGYRFQELFELYSKNVYPAKVVFVSFLNTQHAPGQMFAPMKAAGHNVTQFKLDSRRPDLSKLNALVGLLGLDSDVFMNRVKQLADDEEIALTAQKMDAVNVNA